MFDRRQFFQFAAATAGLAASGFSAPAFAQQGLKMGEPAPFSYEGLKKQARDMAAMPYVPPPRPSPEILEKIDYDAHGKIKFKTDLALWANGPSEFPVTFFHLGRYFQKPARMHVVEKGQAREIVYDNAYFDMPADSPARGLPDNSGFAGFRFQEARNGKLDWQQERLGGVPRRILFPRHRRALPIWPLGPRAWRWTSRSSARPRNSRISRTSISKRRRRNPIPSRCMRFSMDRASPALIASSCSVPKSVIMDIESTIFMRQEVSRLGIAPLTSMYWYSEKSKNTAIDWRPEIHDSDGLAMWTGTRRAHLASAQQPAAHHDLVLQRRATRRASACSSATATSTIISTASITTAGPRSGSSRRATGAGARSSSSRSPPTTRSTTTSWPCGCRPSPRAPGRSFAFAYRMHWSAEEPYPTPLARVVATRFGNGGQAGTARPKGVRKFMVEFMGEPLTRLPKASSRSPC